MDLKRENGTATFYEIQAFVYHKAEKSCMFVCCASMQRITTLFVLKTAKPLLKFRCGQFESLERLNSDNVSIYI